MKKIRIIFINLIILFPLSLQAETLTGVVRTINHSSHSFGLDQPPLVRVYVNETTRYEREGKKVSFQEIKEGDRLEVQAKSSPGNVYVASHLKVLESLVPVKDLDENEVSIQPDQRFLLGVGQTALLKDGKKVALKIKAVDFINTFCKQGYDCTGEGEVGMRLKIQRAGKASEILLTSKDGRKPINPVKVSLFNYEFQLVEAGEDVVVMMVRSAGD